MVGRTFGKSPYVGINAPSRMDTGAKEFDLLTTLVRNASLAL